MIKREAGNTSCEQVAGVSGLLTMFHAMYQNVSQKGSWFPVVSNCLGVARVDVAELAISGGCSTITYARIVKYTATNPDLGKVSLSMNGPGGSRSFAKIRDKVLY